jgi:hypothetical protein
MRRLASLTAALLLVLAPLRAQAVHPLDNVMICDSDGDTIWGDPSDATGKVTVGEKGDLKFSIKPLAPSTSYTCQVECRQTPAGPLSVVVSETCTTSKTGRLLVNFSKAAAPGGLPGGGCFTPQVSILLGATLVCISGYGTVDVP